MKHVSPTIILLTPQANTPNHVTSIRVVGTWSRSFTIRFAYRTAESGFRNANRLDEKELFVDAAPPYTKINMLSLIIPQTLMLQPPNKKGREHNRFGFIRLQTGTHSVDSFIRRNGS